MTDQKRPPLRRTAIALFTVVIIADLAIALFHSTHNGLGSGITELVIFALFVAAMYFIFGSRNAHLRRVGLIIIIAAIPVYVGFGVYHLTSRGVPSGIIELSAACILATLAYLITKRLGS